jgi:hypothetical protein
VSGFYAFRAVLAFPAGRGGAAEVAVLKGPLPPP